MKELLVLVPSRGRPASISRLAQAISSTANRWATDLLVVVDDDDPKVDEYKAVATAWPSMDLQVLSEPRKIGPILNFVAGAYVDQYPHLAFMGDDHLPRTVGWDQLLIGSLTGRPGVAYGNDLHQRRNLPTAVVLSSILVKKLGYISPPGLAHLYIDNFWLELGYAAGNLVYRDDVVIEHMHVAAGKADWDPGYEFSMSQTTINNDAAAWQKFLSERWPVDRRKVEELRG